MPENLELRLDSLIEDEENPNEEDAGTFAALVENIKEYGFIEPVLVAPADDGRYWIVSGHHRVKAARVLGYASVSCIVVPLDNETRKILMVRWNMLRGNLNPFKFTRLFNRLQKEVDPETLRARMAITSERAFHQMYRDVRRSLPPDVVKRLDDAKEEVQDVESLARIIKNIFAKYGEQLDCSFLVFEYGGRQHLMVKMTERTKKNLDRITEECMAEKVDINAYLNRLLERDTGVPLVVGKEQDGD